MGRAVGALIVAGAVLAGCGKPRPPVPAASSASAPDAARSADTAAASAQAPPPPAAADIEKTLLGGGFAIDAMGFSLSHGLTCEETPGAGDPWVVRCRATPTDAGRDGRPAIIEIQLFDHDMAFDPLDAPLKAHVLALDQQWTLDTAPGFKIADHATGVTTEPPGKCRQAIGQSNSPGYCEVLMTPRIFVITGVAPERASTRALQMSPGDDNPENVDVNHAAELADLVVPLIGRAL